MNAGEELIFYAFTYFWDSRSVDQRLPRSDGVTETAWSTPGGVRTKQFALSDLLKAECSSLTVAIKTEFSVTYQYSLLLAMLLNSSCQNWSFLPHQLLHSLPSWNDNPNDWNLLQNTSVFQKATLMNYYQKGKFVYFSS